MSEAPLFDRAKFAGDAKLTYGTVDEYLHMLETMERLDEKGDLLMHRVDASYAPTPVSTLSGRTKAIPTIDLWQHKSCGQCGHIPGYVTALYWIMSELGVPYVDDTNQTSCTAWNYYGSGTSNPVALASVFVRNMHSAWEKDAYPLIHCGTSYGDYKEVRMLLVMNETLREQVRAILKKIGRDLVVPQELVHYSAFIGGVLVPTIIVLMLSVVPFLDPTPRGVGVWFAPERRTANWIFGVLAGIAVLLTIIGTWFRGPNWSWIWPWAG